MQPSTCLVLLGLLSTGCAGSAVKCPPGDAGAQQAPVAQQAPAAPQSQQPQQPQQAAAGAPGGPSPLSPPEGVLADPLASPGSSPAPQGASSASGRLPPEVIQREVRKNFGRFRACYEEGLQRDPKLTGKIAVRFQIGRDGSVTSVRNGGSDMPDIEVLACVAKGFQGLKFPAPEGGIVTVVYPIMFSPGDDDPAPAAPAGGAAPSPAAPKGAAQPAGQQADPLRSVLDGRR